MQYLILIVIFTTSLTHIGHCYAIAFFPVFLNISLLRYNQINAIGLACSMGVEGCRELIKSWYRQWMENPHHNP